MSKNKPEELGLSFWVIVTLVFSLPLTLLVPGFPIWSVIPKVHVKRCFLYHQELTWDQINNAILVLMLLLFCMFLEIRRRKLDDMVEEVLAVKKQTDITLTEDRERQFEAMRACTQLLDTSADHYEKVALLRYELRNRDFKATPPEIQPSDNFQN